MILSADSVSTIDVLTALPAMSFHYLLYGLCVETNRPLDRLIAAPIDRPRDLCIEFGDLAGKDAEQRVPERLWHASQTHHAGQPELRIWSLGDGSYRLQFSDGAEFLCEQSGSRIIVHGTTPLTQTELIIHLYGPVMSFLWLLRGCCCLHASAVVIDGRAAVFLGPPGSGKSTAAALFANQGYEILTDDLAVLSSVDQPLNRWTIPPSFPWLQLRASSRSVINEATTITQATTDRGWYDLDLRSNGFRFREQPAELAAIYLLEPDLADGPFLQRLSPREALMALIANSWTARVLDPRTRQREFEQLSQLASRVPLQRVRRAQHAGSPAAFCDALVDDFRALTR